MNIKELYNLREILVEEGLIEDVKDIDQLIEESTSATGGAGGGSVMSGGTSLANSRPGGHGTIQSSQPGSPKGRDWINGGLSDGEDGDVNVAFNPSGDDRIFQKMPMGKGHGAQTGKKSREKKLDIKHVRDILKNRGSDGEKPGKVMDFNDFTKSQMGDVKKLDK